ncbi:hypothetical protein [Fodinibius sp. SL11]|uniref:hypothetical protein n=1 Tax=Fodinibius sp. SL11 TaxID=3425690 RepID=UPI003F882A50
MQQIKSLLFVFFIALTITQCNNVKSTPDADLHFEGIVTYLEIEGGFWAIQTEDETYEPTNLPSEYQREGLEVTIAANVEENSVSYRMVGPIIRIVDITKR